MRNSVVFHDHVPRPMVRGGGGEEMKLTAAAVMSPEPAFQRPNPVFTLLVI